MTKYIIFENNDESFLANAEKLTAIKEGVALDALIFGPLWPFRGSVTLWLPFLLGTLLTLSPLYFYNSIEDARFAQLLGFTFWFIFGIFYFFQGNRLRVNYLKKNKSFKLLATAQGNSPEGAKQDYRNNETKLLREEEKQRLQAAKELKVKEELDIVKQELAEAKQKEAQIDSEYIKETLVKSQLDKIVNLEQAQSLLIDKKITTSEYIKKAEELKEQEKPAKVKQSNESTDYIGELEKAKKLRDDGDINIDDYEILKQDIMSKIQSK